MAQNWITFNPGPSQLSPEMKRYVHEITDEGILSISHRSREFTEICRKVLVGMHTNMGIPDDFQIYFQPSATAAMDTLLKNLVFKHSYHFVNGYFSERFFKTATDIHLESSSFSATWGEPINIDEAMIPKGTELIALTHTETSTGLMWPSNVMRTLRNAYPNALFAIDVTSTFGSMKMDWSLADVWFGAVQKCLGLPAGLGFLIVNQKAIEKGLEVIKKKGGIAAFQRFDVLRDKMKDYFTLETPNVFAIALLARKMERFDLADIESELYRKADLLYNAPLPWRPYVTDKNWYSPTVGNFSVDDPAIWHRHAEASNLILGSGYGPLKDSCVRVANFPAINYDMMQSLMNVLMKLNP